MERSFPTVGTSARLVFVVSLFLSSVVFFLIPCYLFFLSRFCVSVLFLIMYRPSFLILLFVLNFLYDSISFVVSRCTYPDVPDVVVYFGKNRFY